MLGLIALPADAQSSRKKAPPTKSQTEEWLREHIEAWNDGEIHVTVKECRIVVLDQARKRTEIVALRGLLLPIEVIRLNASRNATFRLRVAQKHSGTFAMYRVCNDANRNCQDPTGKFHGMPWMDLTVTSVDDFVPGRDTDVLKVRRLEKALEHYSNLCGASEDADNLLF